jgi:hypothetical protein
MVWWLREDMGEGDDDDPTDGATNFNLRGNPSTGPLFDNINLPLSTHHGPFDNIYRGGGLPATGVYVNTYWDLRFVEP